MPVATDAVVAEAAELIISRFNYSWAYFCQFRFALAVGQRALMKGIDLTAPSLEVGINDGSSATIAQFGKPKFTYGGDMPEESTFESMGLHMNPNFDVYENVVGMDAHEIPFADGTFNTVVSNDMLSYGLDRKRVLKEMVRVLAPGGTLFVTETTGNAKKYPHLVEQLRSVVPTFHVLDEPTSFYRRELGSLGLVNIASRTWLDHRLCAVLFASLYRGEISNPITEAKRDFYNESLRAIAALLAKELSSSDSGDGWQVVATGTKAGQLAPLPVPRPMCLRCTAPVAADLRKCVCEQCGAEYRTELGNPYILSDYSKVYSPKKTGEKLDMRAVEGLMRPLVEVTSPVTRLNSSKPSAASTDLPGTLVLYGVDKSTRYAIRYLREHGISVSAIYSDSPLFVGCRLLDVPILSLAELGKAASPIAITPFATEGATARIEAAGYRGSVLVPSLAAMQWTRCDFPPLPAA